MTEENQTIETPEINNSELDALKSQLESLKNHNEKLIGEKKNVADSKKEIEQKYNSIQSKYDGVDVDKYKEITEALESQKDKKMLEEGSYEDLRKKHFQKGYEAAKKEYEPKLNNFETNITEYESTISSYKTKLKDYRESGVIKDALIKNKVKPEAVDSAAMVLMQGDPITGVKFEWNDDFDALVGTQSGVPIMAGGEPTKISEYLKGSEFLQKHSYYLLDSSGVNAKGNTNSKSNQSKNPFSKEGWNRAEQAKMINLDKQNGTNAVSQFKQLAGLS